MSVVSSFESDNIYRSQKVASFLLTMIMMILFGRVQLFGEHVQNLVNITSVCLLHGWLGLILQIILFGKLCNVDSYLAVLGVALRRICSI